MPASSRALSRLASPEFSQRCTRCRFGLSREHPSAPSRRPLLRAQAPSHTIFGTSKSFFSSQSSSYRHPSSSSFSSTSDTSETASFSAPPKTHYDLFPQTLPQGPPPSSPFPIDLRTLRREFLSLQACYHPDLHPPASKARAEATSSLINEAYKTLANPLFRAQYLLSLRGINVADDETLKIEEPELLMQVLEAREEIEEAEAEEDLREPGLANEARIRDSEVILEKAFVEDDMEMAKREAVRLRYWVNIKESLTNWEKGKPIVLEH